MYLQLRCAADIQHTAVLKMALSLNYQGQRTVIVQKLKYKVDEALPCRPRDNASSVCVNLIPVELAAASVNVYLGCSQPACTLSEVTEIQNARATGRAKYDLRKLFALPRPDSPTGAATAV